MNNTMKYILLILILTFSTHTFARIKHLSYEEQVQRMQDLREKQKRIIGHIWTPPLCQAKQIP